MAQNWESHYSKGTIGARPAANTLPKGAIYFATDENKYYVGAGVANTWATFAGPFAALAGGVFVGDISVPDDPYDATGWNGSAEVPTKNAIRDKIEAMGGGSGALVQLAELTASASATLDFPSIISATYDVYQIEILNLIPATNAVDLWMRMSTNNGASYDAGANYSYQAFRWITSASAASGAGGANQMVIHGGDSLSNNSSWGLSGTFKIYNPLGAKFKHVTGQTSYLNGGGPTRTGATIGATYESTTAVDAFRLLMSSGNIASGVVRVYGITA